MMTRVDSDVLVAGGGVAGVSTAAALAGLGLSVVLVEPGLDNGKRLAGELVHPPGATDLRALGLLDAIYAAGGRSVRGFAVFPDADARPAAPGEARPPVVHEHTGAYLLPYDEVPGMEPLGVALEHGGITRALLSVLEARRAAEVWRGGRVVRLSEQRDHVEVVVAAEGRERTHRARLLVVADGRTSKLRELAGIRARRTRISQMAGYLLRGDVLPHPGYGHVFMGGAAPALAYQVGSEEIRFMFDVPDNPAGLAAPRTDPSYVEGLPARLRAAVAEAVATQKPRVAANYVIVPEAVHTRRVALVGDAGGCCHPLTATGISISTRDAIRLRDALAASGGDVPGALVRYGVSRRGPQRTRLALAQALYQAFSERSPEMRLVRHGILRYWEESADARIASMALLSTHEGRISMMARQYARVVAHAVPALFSGANGESALERSRTALGLLRAMWRIGLEAARGAGEQPSVD